MVVKFVVFLALAAVASAGDFSSFAYDVADPYTGDFKHQVESRLGNDVRGQYSLLESDGTRRTVDYAAGAEGFNAQVRKDPAFVAPIVTPAIAAHISYAAPAAAAPISYAAPAIAAPVSYAAYAAPSAYSAISPLAYNANYNLGLSPYAYAKYF